MNEDHADSIMLYARAQHDVDWAECATLLQLDRFGMDIHLRGSEQSETVRVAFEQPIANAAELRPRLVELSKQLRGSS